MSTNPKRLQLLFKKYIDNTCNQKELNEFWQLLSGLSEEDIVDEELKALWHKRNDGYNPSASVDGEKIFSRILQRAREQEPDYSKLHRRSGWPRMLMAAAIILCVTSGWWLWSNFNKTQQQNEQAALTVNNNTGHKVYLLPDGTRVTVNLDTKLQYPPVFTGNTREVYLSGEAYFEVAHDADKPFLVHTGHYTTKVLGTKFNVQAYAENPDVLVTVTQGKVQVSDEKNSFGILQPNDQLILNKKTGKAIRNLVNATELSGWINEDLVFQNTSLEKAVEILKERFDVDIRFKNETLRNCQFTGTFLSDNGFEQVIDIITSITHSNWQKEGSTIWLSGKGCEGK